MTPSGVPVIRPSASSRTTPAIELLEPLRGSEERLAPSPRRRGRARARRTRPGRPPSRRHRRPGTRRASCAGPPGSPRPSSGCAPSTSSRRRSRSVDDRRHLEREQEEHAGDQELERIAPRREVDDVDRQQWRGRGRRGRSTCRRWRGSPRPRPRPRSRSPRKTSLSASPVGPERAATALEGSAQAATAALGRGTSGTGAAVVLTRSAGSSRPRSSGADGRWGAPADAPPCRMSLTSRSCSRCCEPRPRRRRGP